MWLDKHVKPHCQDKHVKPHCLDKHVKQHCGDKSKGKIIERGKINSPSIQIYNYVLSWLGTGTSIKKWQGYLISPDCDSYTILMQL
jgi:hypothetical protein